MSVFTPRFIVLAAASIFFALIISAQVRAETKDRRLPAQTRSEVITSISTLIENNYFDAEKAVTIAQNLRAKAAAGVFDGANTRVALAQTLTADLSSLDGHFSVVWTAGEKVTDHHDLDWDTLSRLSNYGFGRAEILAGNIGYLEVTSFETPSIAGPTLEAAMNFLGNTDAIIIDIKNNGGGEPEMVQHFLSYLIGPEPTLVGSIYWRNEDRTQQYWTSPYVSGKQLFNQPLFVLTSAATGSAAEAFALQIKKNQRGKLVGQTTYGAGNPGRFFEAAHEYAIFISYGGPVNPEDAFDKTGVAPNIETAAGEEKARALLLAWDNILDSSSNLTQLAAIKWAQERQLVELNPVTLSEEKMLEFAGNYGDRQIVYRDKSLVYERGRRAPEVLIPGKNDTFYPVGLPNNKMEFMRNKSGDVVQMKMTWNGGHFEIFTRTPF